MDDRKTRPDAVLKNLPPDRQAEIAEMAKKKSLRDACKQLAADGIQVSRTTLGKFLSWYSMTQQFESHEADATTFMEMVAANRPEVSQEQLFLYGQDFFSLLAMKAQNPKEWARIQKLRQKEQDLKFQREKFKEAIKSDIDRALDALFEEVKGNPTALEYFQKFRDSIKEVAK